MVASASWMVRCKACSLTGFWIVKRRSPSLIFPSSVDIEQAVARVDAVSRLSG
jgi:hypothetical protein